MLRWPCLSCAIVLIFFMVSGLSWAGSVATDFSSSTSSAFGSTAPPDSTHLGIVWTPPAGEQASLQALQQMYDTGTTAVRLTRLPSADTVFTRADSLGLHLYLDLPVSYESGEVLRDSLEEVQPTLDRVLNLAGRHSSIQYVGLARYANTTVPATCSVLRQWTDHIHAHPETDLSTYYVTPFLAARDRCSDAVDLPLIDVRGHPSPLARWNQWKQAAEEVGIGGLGTWTRPEAPSGLQIPHSPQWQARYLERALSQLLDSQESSPPALFVYRWQDEGSSLLSSRRYGLHQRDGTPRPAASVVQGRYTDSKHVFAFPSGPSPSSSPFVLLLLGWGLIAVLGGVYTRSSFIRDTLFRYFTAHGFYRDALRRGRKVEAGPHGILLLLVAGALGLTATLAAQGAASLRSTELVLGALSSTLGSVLASALQMPTTTGLLFGGAVLAMLSLWTFALTVMARRWTRFSFAQGLMLVVWPCWPALPLMIFSLVAATHPPVSPTPLGGLLLAGGTLAAITSTLRILSDYYAVTEIPLPTVLLLGGISPVVLTAGVITALLVHYEISVSLVWHLVTHS